MPAEAQSPRSERPYRGLFAGDTGNAEQLLTFSASFGGGYDDDIFANSGVGAGQPTNAAEEHDVSSRLGAVGLQPVEDGDVVFGLVWRWRRLLSGFEPSRRRSL